MISEMAEMISIMVGTLAVILLVAAFIGGTDLVSKLFDRENTVKYTIFAIVIGGVFGIYGNISGFTVNGAIVSVRDIGPMLAGYIGGPIAGFFAGLIAGLQRLSMGGVTAEPCVVATCCIGTICGILSRKWHDIISKPYVAFILAVIMEVFHLSLVLLMVKPFEIAAGIVHSIAIPMILVNALGFMLMIAIITYTEKERKLSKDKARMQADLDVANVIQHSLLPAINENYPNCPSIEASASMDAAKEVGGDFYDVFAAGPTSFAFVIGDVSGKGIPAAIFMASSKNILSNCIRDHENLSDAIETANNVICEMNEAEMFITVWAGIFDYTTGDLTYVSAGHNPPALLRKDRPILLKDQPDFILGGMEGVKFHERSLKLERGDIIYLYTDGVPEAQDKDHHLFGEERLVESLKQKNHCCPKEVISTVSEAVEEFVNGYDQFDDMTMLCFKWLEENKA